MPITMKEIIEHRDYYGITDLDTMHTAHYKQLLTEGAFLFSDSNGSVRSTLSEEIFATNTEQLDAFIAHLLLLREKMNNTPDFMSDK